MALVVTQQPDKFASAYAPLLVKLTSKRYPINNTPGESNIPIIEIRVADATDVSTYGAPLTVGDVFVQHVDTGGASWVKGDKLFIFATGNSLYDGVYGIKGIVGGTITIIDAEDAGLDFGGVCSKQYQGYNIIADMITEASGEITRYRLSADPDGVFTLDAGPLCRRTFKDIFEIAEGSGSIQFIPGNKYITQSWSVIFSEAYMVFDGDTGVGTYVEQGKQGDTATVASKIAVNNVQPYANTSAGHYWEDGLEDYIVDPLISNRTRFLTYGERGGVNSFDINTAQRVADGEDFWLAFLWDRPGSNVGLRIVTFGSDGLQNSLDDVTFSPDAADSYLFNASPDALGSYVPANTDHYYIQLRNAVTGVYSERFYFKIVSPCETAQRFYFLNGMGALDQYTVEGKDVRDTRIRRSTVEKPHMELTLGNEGDWQRRTYAVDITRRYTATTRTERKDTARWLLDEFFESTDVRALSYRNGAKFTRVILDASDPSVGPRGTRFDVTWSYGTDNRKHRR